MARPPDSAPPALPLVLLNPHAAGGRGVALRQRLEAALRAPGLEAALAVPASAAEACDRVAALAAPTRVVVLGGDGSLAPLLGVLVAGGHSVGLVPTGTGNDLARALGVAGLSLTAALRLALQGRATPIDLGHAAFEGREVLFASSLTVGFDTVVTARAQHAPRWLPGQLHYLWATLTELRAPDCWTVRVGLDDAPPVRQTLHLASVLNTASYGSGMPVAPRACIDDGRLDLMRLARLSRLGLLGALQQMLRGAHLRHPAVQSDPFARLVLECDRPLPLAADGDVLGAARRVQVSCRPGALQVVRRPVGTV